MKKALGRLIWTQSRDIRVLNYPSHYVYEIWTNQGYLTLAHNKETDRIEKLNGLLHMASPVSLPNAPDHKTPSELGSPLQ